MIDLIFHTNNTLIKKKTIYIYKEQNGFTLLEVLVAISIIGIALMAAMKSLATVTDQQKTLNDRMVAIWLAEEHLISLRLRAEWPEIGEKSFDCYHGPHKYFCQQIVSKTVNPSFRRIEINVYPDNKKTIKINTLITLQANQSRRSL